MHRGEPLSTGMALKIILHNPGKIAFTALFALLLACGETSPVQKDSDNLTKNSEMEKSDQILPTKKDSDNLNENNAGGKSEQVLPEKRESVNLTKNNKMDEGFNREKSVQLLRSSSTWCKGAGQLAKNGNAEDILQLLATYKTPAESSKLCLLDAMKDLGAIDFAGQIFLRSDKEMKINGLYLMKLFPDDRHLSHLSIALSDSDEQINKQALNALFAQIRTSKWIDTMLALLNHEKEETRLAVVNQLARHKLPHVISALKAQMGRERSAIVKERINEIVKE